MPRKESISNKLINLAIFIIMEVAALFILVNNGALQKFFAVKWSHGFIASVWGKCEATKYYFSLNRENERLAGEVFRLNQRMQAYDAMQEDAEAASRMIQGTEAVSGYTYIPGSIVKASNNKQHNYLILGQGSADGITPGSGVITSQGIVGIIDTVSKHYSYVISFLNSKMSISSRIRHDGAVGPMEWDGKSFDVALLKEIPLQYEFSPQDTVYTSGYSSIFPPDIPLGVITGSRIVNGATYEITIQLFQDFRNLRYVTIVKNDNMDEIEALEQHGGDAK